MNLNSSCLKIGHGILMVDSLIEATPTFFKSNSMESVNIKYGGYKKIIRDIIITIIIK